MGHNWNICEYFLCVLLQNQMFITLLGKNSWGLSTLQKLLAWSAPFVTSCEVVRKLGSFRLTAPAAVLGHLGAISLKLPNFLTTSQDVTKGADQAIYQGLAVPNLITEYQIFFEMFWCYFFFTFRRRRDCTTNYVNKAT